MGQACLFLQNNGLSFTGIGIFPNAVRIASARGLLDARIAGNGDIGSLGDVYETVVLFGNNFGLLHSREEAIRMLSRTAEITPESSTIIAKSLDLYGADVKEHLEYHALNRKHGWMPGQAPVRVRYRKYCTLWLDYILLSLEEMGQILENTPWRILKSFTSGFPLCSVVMGNKDYKKQGGA